MNKQLFCCFGEGKLNMYPMHNADATELNARISVQQNQIFNLGVAGA